MNICSKCNEDHNCGSYCNVCWNEAQTELGQQDAEIIVLRARVRELEEAFDTQNGMLNEAKLKRIQWYSVAQQLAKAWTGPSKGRDLDAEREEALDAFEEGKIKWDVTFTDTLSTLAKLK